MEEKYKVKYTIKKNDQLLEEKTREFSSFIAANNFAKQVRYSELVIGKPVIIEV